MRFLENLRRPTREPKVSKIGWIAEEQRKDRQNLQLAREAKRQFEKSGMPGLIRDLLKGTPGLKFAESAIDWTSYVDGYYPSRFLYRGVYSCEVILEDVPEYHDDPMTRVFIGIVTSPDGTIKFNGDEEGSSILTKDTWKNNKSVLRDALDRAYKNPHRIIRGPATFEDFMYADMA